MMAEHEQMSPLWWLEQLEPKLSVQAAAAARFEMYFDGEQPLPVALSSQEYRDEFERMLREVRDNWMPIVVDAVAERMTPVGFRLSASADGDVPSADREAAKIWQRNFLDADSKLAHGAALTTGLCPVMVWAGKDGTAEITVEHPSQVYVAYESGSRRRRAAAIKRWRDEWTGEWCYNLYLPDGIHKFVRDGGNLRERERLVVNPLRVVPVVELRNRLRLRDGQVRSELMEVLSTQDQINKLTIDMLVASEYAAFRQKWGTGVEVDEDSDGNDPSPVKSGITRMFTVGDDKARFGTFEATDVKQYVELIESRILSLARRTRTPPHYMLGAVAQMPNGESIKAAETGLIAKVKDRQVMCGEAWEEVMRLAFQVEGNAKAGDTELETVWADPETRTESEHVDAVMKRKALGVPTQQLWEDLGYTPTQIARFKSMLLDEALAQLLATPTPTPEPSLPEPVA